MPKTIDELLAEARSRLDRVTPQQALAAQRDGAIIVDTRTLEQRQSTGEIPGAIVIDRTVFEWRLDPQSPWRIPEMSGPGTRVIVVCREGYSSSLAAAMLQELGLVNATDVVGGFHAWRDEGLPVVPFVSSPDLGIGPCDRPAAQEVLERTEHWSRIYRDRSDDLLSWFQPDPALSLRLIEEASPERNARIIDVGAGTSRLAERLLDDGFQHLTILDISTTALERLQVRLGGRASTVRWIAGDVTRVEDVGEVDVWHDRAVFHFLIDPEERERYLSLARRTIPSGGWMILATFALNAPPRCSGLDVRRYDPIALVREVGQGFALVRESREEHVTPSGVRQPFTYVVFRRR